ncbi:40S ribosomal protein mrp2, mitochondrial [Saitoella coloradoensis]
MSMIPKAAFKPGNFCHYVNARVLRDAKNRQAAAEAEPMRQALRYIVRNTSLPPRARAQAQLQLSNMPSETRMTKVVDRCVISGKGRGIFRKFKMSRFVFRMHALEGKLPGVKKAVW